MEFMAGPPMNAQGWTVDQQHQLEGDQAPNPEAAPANVKPVVDQKDEPKQPLHQAWTDTKHQNPLHIGHAPSTSS